LLLGFNLHAELEDHFKPVCDKQMMRTIPGVDCIYMVNLDRRSEKFTAACKEFQPYGIVPCRLSAVDGWSFSVEDVWDVSYRYKFQHERGVMGTCYYVDHNGLVTDYHELINTTEKPYLGHCMSRGAIGCILSHLSILQDAWDSGYECVWVLEDDIKVRSSPLQITALLDELNAYTSDWSVLFTDLDSKKSNGKWSPCKAIRRRPGVQLHSLSYYLKIWQCTENLREIRLRFGTYSYLVSRRGMKQILDYYKEHKVFFPYDIEMPPLLLTLASTTSNWSSFSQLRFASNNSL